MSYFGLAAREQIGVDSSCYKGESFLRIILTSQAARSYYLRAAAATNKSFLKTIAAPEAAWA
jgi:hypothetical protein